MKIAVIGLGKAGSELAGMLAAKEASVTGYDKGYLADKGLEAWRRLSDKGIRLCSSVQDCIEGAALILSLTGESGAMAAAEEVSRFITEEQNYCDLNLFSPLDKERIRGIFTKGKISEGTIMKASLKMEGAKTPIYVSGEYGGEVAGILKTCGLNATYISSRFGAASGLKLIKGIFMKSIETTLMETAHGAQCLGIQDIFLREVKNSFKNTSHFDQKLKEMIVTCPNHSKRHGEEVLESKALLDQLGIDVTMSKAIAQKFFYVAGLNIDAILGGQIPEKEEDVLKYLPMQL